MGTGVRPWALWALSGVWLGLSINAYTAARVLPVIFVVFAVYVVRVERAQWRRWWGGIAITLGMAAIVVLPLCLHLVRHRGVDQLSFYDINRPLIELRRGNLAPMAETALRTLGMFAFFGDPLPYYDVPGRPIFEPVGALLLALGLCIALWRWRQPRYAFVVLWFLISLAPSMLSQPAPNYTRTLGVQVVLFALPGIAVTTLREWRERLLWKRFGAWIRVALGLLFVGNLAWSVRDYFFVWPSVEAVRFWYQAELKTVADWLQAQSDPSPVAVCVPYHLIDERDPWWKPAWQHMRYLLRRSDLSLRYYDCAEALVVVEGPTRYVFPDVADVDTLHRFPIYQFMTDADLDLEFLPGGHTLVARGEVTPALVECAADSVVAWAPEVGVVDQLARAPVNFQDVVEFLGYTAPTAPLRRGEAFDLVTYWRVTGALPPRLFQFTHVLNAEGGIVAQQDRLALTSASLGVGDVFAQVHHLTLPGDAAAGEYALTIGLFTPADGARLQITQAGQPRGDRLWLRPLVVGE